MAFIPLIWQYFILYTIIDSTVIHFICFLNITSGARQVENSRQETKNQEPAEIEDSIHKILNQKPEIHYTKQKIINSRSKLKTENYKPGNSQN